MSRIHCFLAAACVVASVGVSVSGAPLVQEPTPRLIRALSGPSGKVDGAQFIFDETRNRFVYPQDRTLTVYFEWEVPAGDHVLVATWRQPDGRVATVSPDVKIKTADAKLNSYWIFNIAPNTLGGAWSVEIRIDGQPAGSHAFELAGLDTVATFTLDRVVKTFGPSMVTVSRLDEAGRRIDTGSGFVVGPNAVLTAFQVIDMAATIELEFADGRRARTVDVMAASRLNDWAILKVDTGEVPAIPRGDAQAIPVGSRLAVFNVEAGTRVIMPVDVGAVSAPQGYNRRIRFSPGAGVEAMGGPVFDERGTVVGILGGSLLPGSRIGKGMLQAFVSGTSAAGNTATVITDVPLSMPVTASTLAELKATGLLSPPVRPMPEFIYGGVTTQLPKTANDRTAPGAAEISARNDAQVAVYSYWIKRDKLSKGEIGGGIFNASNQLRGTFQSKKVSLGSGEQRIAFTFSPKGLMPGAYRIDVTWDGKVVWRAYVQVIE